MDKTHGFFVVGLLHLLSSFLLCLYADVNEYNKLNQTNQVAFDKSRPGGKERKSQIKAQTVSTYIAGKAH